MLLSMSIIDNLYMDFSSCWRRASRKKKALIYVGIYTVVFLTAFLIAYSPFLREGKTFVWQIDGRTLHFTHLVYIGRAFRRIALNILNGNFAIPMFDLSIGGGGGDVIGFFGSQGQTDPLLLLSAFVPIRYSEYLFAFLTIFRVYLAGLSFSFLCFYFRKKAMHALIGSVVYCFCGYAILCSMRHPYFINPMILLPLLTVGIEKILRREKPYFFISAMFYAALCGYYHIYMMTIMLVVYAIVRFLDLYQQERFKKFLSFAGGGISAYLLGIGLAAIIFLPAVAEFLNCYRAGSSMYYGIYRWPYHKTRLLRLIAPPGGWTDMSFAAIVLFALALLFFSKGKRSLKILTAVAFAVWMTSAGGMIMNGFVYPSNRWTFCWALLAAYIVVEMLPQLLNLSRKHRVICFAVFILYTTAYIATELTRRVNYVRVGAIFLALTLLVLSISFKKKEEQTKLQEKGCTMRTFRGLRECLCLSLVIANVGVNALYKFAPNHGKYAAQFQKSGFEVNRLEKSIERELEPYLLNSPTGRGDGSEFFINTSMVWQIPGLLAFSGTLSKDITNFWRSLELSGSACAYYFLSTEQKTIANTLLSVKYQAEPLKNAGHVPFGYERIKKTKKGNVIYENKYALPWGYTYDHAIAYSELTHFNGVEKQEAMLQAIALDEKAVSGVKLNGVQFDAKKVPYEFVCNGCTWQDGKLVVAKNNATITFNFVMPANVEGYVRLNRFDIDKSRFRLYSFQVNCENIERHEEAGSSLLVGNTGRKSCLAGLGYSERERKSLTITFPRKGTFELKDIELFALPMDNYPARVEALRAEPLENVQWGTNSLSGTVDLSKDKILCLSVPYSKGWSATVDGEKVDILRGNYAFMALPLKAGHHDIKFSFCSPGLKPGAAISALCACIVAGMFVRDRRRRRKVE